jgi:hypothetical protein
MRTPILKTTLTLTLILSLPGLVVAAAPPELLNYQGVLRDASDTPLDGSHDMVFDLYDDPGDAACEGGTLLISDAHLASGSGAVTVRDGLFNASIGDGELTPGTESSLTGVFSNHATVYLQIAVEGETLCPRVRVLAAGYALSADTLDGQDGSFYLDGSSATQEKTGLLVASGGVDFGPGKDDDLDASDVTALTAGASADALHTHSSVGTADTLDGLDSSQFLRSDASDEYTNGRLTMGVNTFLDVEGGFSAGGTIYLDDDGPDGNQQIYFFDDGSSKNEYLRWNEAKTRFEFSSDLQADRITTHKYFDASDTDYYVDPADRSVINSLWVNDDHINLNGDGPEGDTSIHFYDDGGPGGQQLIWDDSENRFRFTGSVHSEGTLYSNRLADPRDEDYFVAPFAYGDSARFYGNISIGHGSGTDSDMVFFDEDLEYLEWNDYGGYFYVSNDVRINSDIYAARLYDKDDDHYVVHPRSTSTINLLNLDGHALHLNHGGPDGNASIYFHEGGSAYGESLNWDDGDDMFWLSDDLYVTDSSAGIEAQGFHRGGRFVDSDDTGWADVGRGDYGIWAEGSYRGGYFRDSGSGAYLRAATGSNSTEGNGAKNFVQNHPYDAARIVVYTALEGGEAGTYTRGSARLIDGRARVALDETFAWVTNPDIGLTAHLTLRADLPEPLWVAEISTSELVVHGPPGSDAPFDYLVHGLRIGFEQAGTVRPKENGEAFIPSMEQHRAIQRKRPELRAFTPLARFEKMAAAVTGLDEPVDLTASEALRDAIIEWSPALAATIGPAGDRPAIDSPAQDRRQDEPASPAPPDDAMPGTGAGGDPSSASAALPTALPVDADGNVYARSFRPSARDFAELVPVAGAVEAGDVVVIDTATPGQMRLATRAADSAVFGVVAADPGVVLGASPPETEPSAVGNDAKTIPAPVGAPASSTDDVPVATSGVTLCKVDAGYASIEPGDLLTTSPTPGHAMRTDDPQPGTILGKALEPLEVGTGLVRILVTLR